MQPICQPGEKKHNPLLLRILQTGGRYVVSVENVNDCPDSRNRSDPRSAAVSVLRPEFEWPYVKISAPVDRKHDGRFWFTGLKPGTYQVEVTRDGRSEPPIRLPSIDLTGTIKRDLVVATD